MDKAAFLVLLAVFSALTTTGCGDKISPQEVKVLEVMGQVQRGVETNNEYAQFEQSLAAAKAEIERLKQDGNPNPCFQGAVEKSYASYEIVSKAWQKKMTEKEEGRKADLEATLSFSLSFSAINLERAKKCYE
jgi:hypothetical protein